MDRGLAVHRETKCCWYAYVIVIDDGSIADTPRRGTLLGPMQQKSDNKRWWYDCVTA